MKKIRALIESVLLIGIVYLVYEIMYFAYGYLILYGIKDQWEYIKIERYEHLKTVEDISLNYIGEHPLEYTLLCWVIIIGLFTIVMVVNKQKFSQLFILKRLSFKNALASILIGIGLVFIINGIVRYMVAELDFDISYLENEIFRVYDFAYVIIIVGVLTPIFEELFFRGIILSRLIISFGSVLSVLISAIIFSTSHLNLVQSIYVLPIGILSAVLVIRTGSVLSSMWLHIFYNMVNIYLAKIDFFQYNSVQLLMIIVIGMVLFVFGLKELEDGRDEVSVIS